MPSLRRSRRPHPGARPWARRRLVPPTRSVLLVVAVAGFLVAALVVRLDRTDAADRTRPDPPGAAGPAEVAPPDGLELPDLLDPRGRVPVAVPLPPSRADAGRVADVVGPLARRSGLGRRVNVAVADLDGTRLTTVGPGTFVPASLTKLLTGAAATAVLDPGARFTTTAELQGRTGSRPVLHLVGGGDPLLSTTRSEGPDDVRVADLTSLARQSARALEARGVTTVRLRYDADRFSGDGRNAAWPEAYYSGVTAPVTALMVDQGRTGGFGRAEDPARAAALAYADALRARGVTVRGRTRPAAGPGGPASQRVGAVRSAPVAVLVRHMLETSDNTVAEVLGHHVALARGRTADFVGAARATTGVLRELGVPTEGLRLRDGSGLSRRNRVSTDTVLGVLRAATSAGRPDLRPVVTGLPVSGFTGSLAERFTGAPDAALGTVRAKTGTLSGVHGLAGTLTARDGTQMIFVAVADRVPPRRSLDARRLLARMAARLAACRCAAPRAGGTG